MDLAKRNAELIETSIKTNWSFRKLAAKFSLSDERVRQILEDEAGLVTARKLAKVNQALELEQSKLARAVERKQLEKKVIERANTTPILSYAELGKLFGLDKMTAWSIVKKAGGRKVVRSSGGYPNSIKGILQTSKGGTIYYRSNCERRFAESLDSDNNVAEFWHDRVRLGYIEKEKQRIYVVDFLVRTTTNELRLVEVKPKDLSSSSSNGYLNALADNNKAKFEAARSWGEAHNIKFEVVFM